MFLALFLNLICNCFLIFWFFFQHHIHFLWKLRRGSDKMEALDVLNMGNISNFKKLDHYNCHLFFTSSNYRAHGTPNDRLEPRVSLQKSIWKYMHLVQRYLQKGKIFLTFSWKAEFCQFIRTRCKFFKTNFCIETLGSSRTLWVPIIRLIKGSLNLKRKKR